MEIFHHSWESIQVGRWEGRRCAILDSPHPLLVVQKAANRCFKFHLRFPGINAALARDAVDAGSYPHSSG